MRLTRGWTRKRIVEEFGAGRRVAYLAFNAYSNGRSPLSQEPWVITPEGWLAVQWVEAILRAALREQGK